MKTAVSFRVFSRVSVPILFVCGIAIYSTGCDFSSGLKASGSVPSSLALKNDDAGKKQGEQKLTTQNGDSDPAVPVSGTLFWLQLIKKKLQLATT